MRLVPVTAAVLLTAASVVGAASTAVAASPPCGVVVTQSIVLAADLDCTALAGPALRVGADGITVDLGGHSVRSSGDGAIVNDGFDGVTIENGSASADTKAVVLADGADDNHLTGLSGSSAGGAFVEVSDSTETLVEGISDAWTINGHTVVLIRSSHATIRSIDTADGIELVSSSDNLVTGNQIGASDVGAINVSGDRNEIRGNVVDGSSVHLAGPGTGNVVADNSVRRAYDAIYVGEGMSGTVLSGNTVSDATDTGILVDLGSTGTTITKNTARNISAAPGADAVSGTGIRLKASSATVTGNRVYANAGWGIHSQYAVTDGGGNIAYSNAAGGCFNVACSAPDVVAPTVVTKTPAANASAVAVSGNVTAAFSEPVQGVTTSSFKVKTPAGAAVRATVRYNATTRVATLDPSANLAPDTKYTATLTGSPSAIRDAAGNALASTSWTFTTGPAPTITARTPAHGATGVGPTANITATFSEPVRGVTGTTFRLKKAATGAAVSAIVRRNGTTNQWVLDPGVTLSPSTRYTVTLTGGPSGARDLANNALATTSWSFTTRR